MAGLRRQVDTGVLFSLSIIDHRYSFIRDEDWEAAFQRVREGKKGTVIVRFQARDTVLFSDLVPIEDVTYEKMKPIIDKYHWGSIHNYDEDIVCLTYVLFESPRNQ